MPTTSFHPAVQRWFETRFPSGPSAPQARGWPSIQEGRNTLIAAPTGSGKTLAAFLVCLDRLVKQGLASGLQDQTQILYVSPLKALGNDIEKNLEEPLAGIAESARELGLSMPTIRIAVRSGDTRASQRQAIVKRPPHLLITTPESLYLLLTSERGRALLKPVRTVIVDEIHALADDRRGSHLSLSLERLEALAEGPLQRIGLSATQNPIEEVARFLVGTGRIDAHGTPDCVIVDESRPRELDLHIEIPRSELSAVASTEQWTEIYDRLAELISAHRTTLVFVNTRRLVERVARALQERVGEKLVAAHHGSLARPQRLLAEQQLKNAEIKAAVATASLELGVDLGAVELVCQIGSPRSLSVGIQRIGRSGHFLGAIPKGRLFALSRDDLIECAAFVRGVLKRRLDRIEVPKAPLDILAQQIAASCAAETWDEDALFSLCRRAYPYATLTRHDFDRVVQMLAEGIAPGRSQKKPLLHRDSVGHRLKARRGTRLIALTSGGAIPDQADLAVVAEPEGLTIGTVHEDFAAEAAVGDLFLLGSTSWRILRVETGRVRVADAQGAPASVPFWLGEAPGRSPELSEEVSLLRADLEPRLQSPESAAMWLAEDGHMDLSAALQAVTYLGAGKAALGALPTCQTLIAERFFDEAGGMQLVVHAPFGARLNRGFGMGLRKSFCRTFDFELQAAATDDGVLLSLGPQHSFPLSSIFEFLSPATLRETLVQAALQAPMFQVRWRWNGQRALQVVRRRGGKKVPPNILRMQSDDLLAAVFPEQTACQDNAGGGPIEVPDQPLVRQAIDDCLHEVMDIDGLSALLERMGRGELRLLAVDVPEPSPLCHEILNARPYSYLDDAPLEERRARAVATRRTLSVKDASELGALDPAAIAQVVSEAAPAPRDADELHELLLAVGLLPHSEVPPAWRAWLGELISTRRVITLAEGVAAVEREALVRAALGGGGTLEDEGFDLIVRGHLDHAGPVAAPALAARLSLPASAVEAALHRLESRGIVLRGSFTPGRGAGAPVEWCERGLLARIHRLTLGKLRKEIEPVTAAQLIDFLLGWQHVAPGTQLHGAQGLLEVLGQLQGFPAAAGAWERDILPARIAKYSPELLDQLCLGGQVVWGRFSRRPDNKGDVPVRRNGPTRAAPVSFALRPELSWVMSWQRRGESPLPLGEAAQALRDLLAQRGALFLPEIQALTGRIPSELEQSLWELVAAGEVTCDGFAGLRMLIGGVKQTRRHERFQPSRRSLVPGGRWSLLWPGGSLVVGDTGAESKEATAAGDPEALELLARQLLRRYGVVFRDALGREVGLPPWRELLWTLRRMEARGELRGGRFVAGFQGEQFALPEAVEALRSLRRATADASAPRPAIRVGAPDPLNLVGILTPAPRVPAVLGQRVTYVGGVAS
jgi:ATP-dependent helicase Lhr and Lhr-like helicase